MQILLQIRKTRKYLVDMVRSTIKRRKRRNSLSARFLPEALPIESFRGGNKLLRLTCNAKCSNWKAQGKPIVLIDMLATLRVGSLGCSMACRITQKPQRTGTQSQRLNVGGGQPPGRDIISRKTSLRLFKNVFAGKTFIRAGYQFLKWPQKVKNKQDCCVSEFHSLPCRYHRLEPCSQE